MPGSMSPDEGGARRNPVPTVDAIIVYRGGIVLVERLNPPPGWALPGGFVDYGESLEAAVAREAREETNLELEDVRQFHTYSDPGRDPRMHTVTTVFSARGVGELMGGDDACRAEVFLADELPATMAFDHRAILEDYLSGRWR